MGFLKLQETHAGEHLDAVVLLMPNSNVPCKGSKHLRNQLVFEEISLKGSAAFYSKKVRYVELNFPHMLPLFPTIYGAHS